MKAVVAAMLISCAQVFAQETVSSWFALDVGNQWLYEHEVRTGLVYPALHRLEKKGWLKSEWKQTDSNQRAKFYRLTPAGKKQLLSEQERWWHMVKAMTAIMGPAPTEG